MLPHAAAEHSPCQTKIGQQAQVQGMGVLVRSPTLPAEAANGAERGKYKK